MGKTYTVFTYGSLMKGFYGHETQMADAEFLGSATVNGDLRYFCSDYPVLVKKTKGGKPIKGELYLVDEPTMERLRKYEGIGSPLTCYTEKVVRADTSEGPVIARAFVAATAVELPMIFTSRHIPECDWRSFKKGRKRLPVSKPLMLFMGACVLGAAFWELVAGFAHI